MTTKTESNRLAVLREAARILRERASLAASGSWTHEDHTSSTQGRPVHYVVASDAGVVVGTHYVDDARWIVLMGPEIAEPLANHLDVAADTLGEILAVDGPEVTSGWDTVLDLARTIIESNMSIIENRK